mmetsp:Transcript_49947/g.118139  ORF Transcript_49947/g.118139 Transcript_49947/m.118139 type:complete len:119 (+) Transcript_49947:237-593(+)
MFLSLRRREVGAGAARGRSSATNNATVLANNGAPFSPLRLTRTVRAAGAFARRLELEAVHDWHDGCVNTISFTEGGDQLISGSDDEKIVIGRWETGEVTLQYESGHTNNVFQAKTMPH